MAAADKGDGGARCDASAGAAGGRTAPAGAMPGRAAPANAAPWRTAAAGAAPAGRAPAVLDKRLLSDCAAAHASLASQLGFPEWYGANLAALADMLGEICEPTRIVVEHAGHTGGDAGFDAWFSGKLLPVLEREARANPALELEVSPTR